MTKAVGRPQKYTDEFLDKESEALIEFAETAHIPFLFKFASDRGYYSELLSRWADRHEKFSHALKRFKDIQKYKIVMSAMAGKINTTMAIFTLKNVAQWRDDTGSSKVMTQVLVGADIDAKVKELNAKQRRSNVKAD